ncbi:MAG: hypothetical protein HY270_16000 [Deltaproteobacteria bacterium]|nr:hypothetical protein [Deltaproteobacteria bacterium]
MDVHLANKTRSVATHGFLALAAVAMVIRPAAADETVHQKLKVSLGYHFSSGTYGTGERTEIAYVPLIVRAERGLWTFELTVPYLRISGPSTILTGQSQTSKVDSDGLGDISSRGSYTLLPVTDWMPYIDLIARVKFPSASHSKGLGTGKFDFGFETELAWSLKRFTPFVDVGYRFLGSPSGTTLRDVVLGSIGGFYRLADPLWIGLLLDYRDAASAANGTRLEISPFMSWKVDQHWSVDTYASAGLAKGSPDAGVGLQLGYTF